MANDEPKQVIVVRKDLNMRRGKQIAQGAHASMKAILSEGCFMQSLQHSELVIPLTRPELQEWLEGRFTKVCVSVDSEQELLDIYQQAKDAGLICSLITDAGLTEFNGVPTNTVVAVGPAYPDDVNKITGHLKLL
ncbi:MAG: aminoacyl-tRNA hydrolase [Methylotenera sp.]|nr:MAG: aminoacyl-tRNA hydrolase [Methylotenera sp.]